MNRSRVVTACVALMLAVACYPYPSTVQISPPQIVRRAPLADLQLSTDPSIQQSVDIDVVIDPNGVPVMIRGANYANIFDLGAMPDEIAALTGGHAFHVIVLPGPGSHQAVLGPNRNFVSVSSDEFDEFRAGDQRLTRVLSNPNASGHEVIDLRALRPLAVRGLDSWNSDVVRTILGYDAAVIWKGAHASSV